MSDLCRADPREAAGREDVGAGEDVPPDHLPRLRIARPERDDPPDAVDAHPPPNAAGSGREVSRSVACAPLDRCRRISFRSGQRQRLSPLISRTRSAGAKNSSQGWSAPSVPSSSGSSDQMSGMPAVGVAEALPDLVSQVVEVDRRGLAPDRGELRQRVAEDGQPRTGSSGFGVSSVSGRSRVPSPAASTRALSRLPCMIRLHGRMGAYPKTISGGESGCCLR